MGELLPGIAASPNVHPLLVHFPLALLPAALAFWAVALWRGREELWRTGRWVLYLGVLGSLAVAASGLWAEDHLTHSELTHPLIEAHEEWMLVATGLATATAAAAYALRRSVTGITRPLLLVALLVTTLVTALGADRGALLVYGHGVGVTVAAPAEPPTDSPAEHEHQHEH